VPGRRHHPEPPVLRTPAGPFDVAPGGATPLSATYTPTDVGADTGCLAVASDDPVTPSATLQLAGTGAQPPVASGDVDIDELKVPGGADTRRDRQIVPRAELRNRGSAEAVAKQLGIDIVHFQVLPENKAAIVGQLKDQLTQDGGRVAIVYNRTSTWRSNVWLSSRLAKSRLPRSCRA